MLRAKWSSFKEQVPVDLKSMVISLNHKVVAEMKSEGNRYFIYIIKEGTKFGLIKVEGCTYTLDEIQRASTPKIEANRFRLNIFNSIEWFDTPEALKTRLKLMQKFDTNKNIYTINVLIKRIK